MSLPPSARQFLQTHSVAYPARLLPGYPTPAPAPMASNQWPFFVPNPQPTIAPVVLVQQQTAPAAVNSHEVNNLIMSSPQKPQSLMTSDELNRKVDQQIKQHWFLLGERAPLPSPRPPTTSFTSALPPHPPSAHHHHHTHHSHPHDHHHHHSHSTNSSPVSSRPRKKSVCFDDTSISRRHSVDDLDVSRQSTPLKSCLKSSSLTKDDRYSPVNSMQEIPTQTVSSSPLVRPTSAVSSSTVHRSTSVPNSIEHWRGRQLKSAPSNASYSSLSSVAPGPRRKNLGYLYEKVRHPLRRLFIAIQNHLCLGPTRGERGILSKTDPTG